MMSGGSGGTGGSDGLILRSTQEKFVWWLLQSGSYSIYRAYEKHLLDEFVPCVSWQFVEETGKWIATVDAWDAYCEDCCEEIADYLVRLHLLGKLHSIQILCCFEDSYRDWYNCNRRYFMSVVRDDVVHALADSKLSHKVVMVYGSTSFF